MAKTQIFRLTKHRLIFSKICLLMLSSLLMLVDVASGSGSGSSANKLEKTSKIYDATFEKNTADQEPHLPILPSAAPIMQLVDDVYENQSYMKDVIPFKELKIVKRAPSGFTGMRGKKSIEQSGSDEGDNTFEWNNHDIYKYLNYLDDSVNNRYKKAPTAFYGVRGKKYPNGIFDYRPSGINHIIQEMEEERLRKSMLENFIDQLAERVVTQNEIAKRAPTGFTGMRGKRPAYNFYENDYNDDSQMTDDMEMEKRGPNKAFVGVRGKKDLTNYESRQHQAFKRSPREVYNNADAIGAKRQRFVDFGNKFVAVRGKKNSIADNNSDVNNVKDITNAMGNFSGTLKQNRHRGEMRYFVNMLPSLFFGSSGDVGGKRTPVGFLGLRGKRSNGKISDSALQQSN